MIAVGISSLDIWPRERIRIYPENVLPALLQVRFDTVYSKNFFKDQYNTNFGWLTSVPNPSLIYSPNTHPLIDHPTVFPLDWNVRQQDDNFLQGEIVMEGGVSGFTIFPTHTFPKYLSRTTNTLEISCVLSNALLLKDIHSVNSDWNGYYVDYDKCLQSPQRTFSGSLSSWTFDRAYYAGCRENYKAVSISPTHSATTFTFNLPVSVIPETLMIDLPITNVDPSKSPYGYTGDSTYKLYDFKRDGNLRGLERSDLLENPITGTINYNSGLVSITYTNGYFASTGDVFINYRAKNSITSDLSAKNVYTNTLYPFSSVLSDRIMFSALKPIYLFDIPFRFADYTNYIPTINWHLSSFALNLGTSAVTVSSVMVDNFKQSHWDLKSSENYAKLKFENNTSGDPKTLSAFNLQDNTSLLENIWYPATTDFSFQNSGFFRNYNVTMSLSSVNDCIETESVNFNLNNSKTTLIVSVISSDRNSALVQAASEAVLHNPYGVKWTFDPPDNITIKSVTYSGLDIPVDTYVNPASSMLIYVNNLGVEDTYINFFTEEYGASARAKWFSSEVLSSLPFKIDGYIDVLNETRNGTLSAKLEKNSLLYPIPSWSNIQWSEWHTPNSEATITAKSKKTGNNIVFGNYYVGYEGGVINWSVSAKCNETFALDVFTPISARNFSPVHNLTSNLLQFHIPERPCLSYTSMYVSGISGNGDLNYDGLNQCTTIPVLTGLNPVSLTANIATLTLNNYNQIQWYYNNQFFATGYIVTANLSSNYLATSSLRVFVSAASAKYGSFPVFNYEDTVDVCFVSNLTPFSFELWPSHKWLGATKTPITTKSNSGGVSAYGYCHTECFNFSALSGFDLYRCEIDGIITDHNSNQFVRCVSTPTTGTKCVSISAYNDCYDTKCGANKYNYAKTTGTNKFNQCISFKDYPNGQNDSSISNNIFNLNNPNNRVFDITLNINYPNTPVKIQNGEFSICLDTGCEFLDFDGNGNIFRGAWDLVDETNLFYIEENIFNIKTLAISPSGYKKIPNEDYCTKFEVVSTKSLTVSVYHGPEIAFFTPYQCASANQDLLVYNHTQDFTNNFGYSSFKVDFGDGSNKMFPASSTSFNKSYSSYGTYSWNITGYFKNRDTNIIKYTDFIKIQPTCSYIDESTIIRKFPTTIQLPYECCDLQEIQNDWTTHDKINNLFDKIDDNFQYIKNLTTIYDPNIPNYYSGWIGNKNSNKLKYIFDSNSNYPQYTFSDIQDIFYKNDRFYIINDRNIVLLNDGFYPESIYNSDNITVGEVFQKPVAISYNSDYDEIYILDENKNSFYVFTYQTGLLNLKYYFGGSGSESVETKFNGPKDFCIGENGNIVICDTNNKVLKTYTRYLNWIDTIVLDDEPVSVTYDGDFYYVASISGTINKFDLSWNKILSWDLETTNVVKIRYNLDFKGNLYVVFDDHVENYNSFGIRKGTYQLPKSRRYCSVAYNKQNVFVSENNKIHKFCECEKYITLCNLSGVCFWEKDSYKFHEEEFIQPSLFEDSFTKIWINFNKFKDLVNQIFVEYKNPYNDEFESFGLESYSTSAIFLEKPAFGMNENADFKTLGREILKVCNNTNKLLDLVDVKRKYKTYTLSGCDTWANLMANDNLDFGTGDKINSLSWYEVTKGFVPLSSRNLNYNYYNNIFASATSNYSINTWGNYIDIPYTLSACNLIKSMFTTVSCNSAQNIIRFSVEKSC